VTLIVHNTARGLVIRMDGLIVSCRWSNQHSGVLVAQGPDPTTKPQLPRLTADLAKVE
jgi:hypothetical protein